MRQKKEQPDLILPNIIDYAQLISLIRQRFSANLGTWIVTLNSDIHRQLSAPESKLLLEKIQGKALITADGFPIKLLSSYVTGKEFKRVTGAGAIPMLIEISVELGIPIIFAGGKFGDAAKAVQKLSLLHPTAKSKALELPFAESEVIASYIRSNIPFDLFILFLGVGALKAEYVISELVENYPKSIFIGCGAGISFFAGTIKRAPWYVRKLNLEWLFRLLLEPTRLFQRYIVNDFPHILRLLKMGRSKRQISKSDT